jgi:hypothetical protein
LAVSGGGPVPDGSWGFVAKVDVGGVRACTGALVSPQWVLTAGSCFAVNGQPVTAGAPTVPTTVTVGRTDLSGSAGRVLPVVEIVPRPDRDVALARLSLRVTDIPPITVTGSAPAVGDVVQVAGYGRTATEWVPDHLQAAPAAVGTVTADAFTWTGQGGSQATACKGDAGGPVFRNTGGQPELVGLDIASWQGGCLTEPDTRFGATAQRVDDLKIWIAQHTPGLTATFVPYFSNSTGIGRYDLGNAVDQVVPFDYDHSGKLDHLVLYRPGAGAILIARHDPDNTYPSVAESVTGIGGYDLRNAADRVVPFDYDHSGKLDHLLLYRPGTRTVFILKHGAGSSFAAVYSTTTTGIGGYNLADARDRIVAFDYDHSGKQDHLLLYRPGARTAFVVGHGTGNTFTAVYSSTTAGIGGYDLADARDQVTAFDYEHTGMLDHLVLYRPGAKRIAILAHSTGNTFTAVYSTATAGIGGFDLAIDRDRIVAFDYDHTGGPGYLLLYRPGNRIVWIVGRKPEQPIGALATVRPAADAPGSIVEDFSYPGAAAIEASLNVKLISGDGHILLADCATQPVDNVGVVRVWTTEQIGANGAGQICFKVSGPVGRLALNVPGVYEIRGDGQQAGFGHQLTAVVQTQTGPPVSVVVNPSGSTQVGIGTDPNADPTGLLELRVPS